MKYIHTIFQTFSLGIKRDIPVQTIIKICNFTYNYKRPQQLIVLLVISILMESIINWVFSYIANKNSALWTKCRKKLTATLGKRLLTTVVYPEMWYICSSGTQCPLYSAASLG